jgi:anhydro-N-acetylmuramic acid kinase
MWTAQAVGGARRWLHGAVDEVVAGGGGVRNRTLMSYLASAFDPIPVKTFHDLGWDSKAFEAIAFALLAYQTMAGECANLPAVTGATHPVLLGAIVPGAPDWMRGIRRERRRR